MFDLNRALQNWMAPFRVSHIYSSDDLMELESHLLDRMEVALKDGASEEDAFWMALEKVGDEPTLRRQYQLGWGELSWVKRFWRLLTNETVGFTSPGRRIGYAVARAVSLLVGLVAPVYLFALLVFLAAGFKLIEFGRPVYEQGMLFTVLWGLQGPFSWLPIRNWTGKISDWMRLGFAVASIFVALVFLLVHPDFHIGSGGLIGVLSISTAFSIGPVLWLLQTVSRGGYRVDYDSLLVRVSDRASQ